MDRPLLLHPPKEMSVPEGMVWIPGGRFTQGAIKGDTLAMVHERPDHQVELNGFFMDAYEVTNGEYAKFVAETGYVTIAEREIDWTSMKEQLPSDTPKPPDDMLLPGSLVFKKPEVPITNFIDYSQWWQWRVGANWRMPQGSGSSISGKDDHPVVHIAYEDALAYCEWKGRRLPTEAEWEYAARANDANAIFAWGSDLFLLEGRANTWTGEFPGTNDSGDGYERTAPVASYPANGFGLYDMSGNVWEWTGDWYDTNYYKGLVQQGIAQNPKGAPNPFNPNNPYAREKVIKGGSFLCSTSYCAGYRISARMSTTTDSAMEHLGFRTVLEVAGDKKNNKD